MRIATRKCWVCRLSGEVGKSFLLWNHTFLHKPLENHVFMRCLAMYDGLNILHKSYIHLHSYTHKTLFKEWKGFAQDGSWLWATEFKAVGNRWTSGVQPLPKLLDWFWAIEKRCLQTIPIILWRTLDVCTNVGECMVLGVYDYRMNTKTNVGYSTCRRATDMINLFM